MKHCWEAVKYFCANHNQHAWLENHFIYFSVILGGLSIIVIAFVINRKLQKDIDKMNRESRKTNVQFMRDTSERIKKEKEEKRKLKFED